MIARASCQSCGEITVYTGDRRCRYCDGELCQIDISGHGRRPGRSDNNRTRWNDRRREQVIEAYAQGHDIPEIAFVIYEAMGYKNPATARAAIRQEFKRMGVALRKPRMCEIEGCGRNAITESEFCFSHAPEMSQRRHEICANTRAGIANWPRRGADHHNAKIDDADALAIRLSDDSLESLAERHGLTVEHVRKIRRGRSWTHLEAA